MDRFSVKEKIQYSTAIGTLLSGIVMCFLSFFMHKHTIDSTVLMYFGQTLIFCAGIFGVNLFIKTKIMEVESRINNKIDKRIKDIEKTET